MADWTTVGVAAATGASAVGAAWITSVTQSRTGRYQADADIRKDAVKRRLAAYEQLLVVVDGFRELWAEALRVYIEEKETDHLDELASAFQTLWHDYEIATNRVYLVGTDDVLAAAREMNAAYIAFSERLSEALSRARAEGDLLPISR